MKAVGFRVVVLPDPVEEKTESGIILALDKKMEAGATQSGTVVDIGPEAFRSYNRAAGFTTYVPWCNIGDRVSFARYAGKWVDEGDKEYLVLNDEDIVAILEKK